MRFAIFKFDFNYNYVLVPLCLPLKKTNKIKKMNPNTPLYGRGKGVS